LRLLADAEGAAHTIAIQVEHAASEDDAVQVARAVARSNLFKCAVFGQDPNWGRVLAAIGTTTADFEPERIDVAFNGVQVCRDGSIGDPRDLVDLSGHEVRVEINLRNGPHAATVWTNDLSYDYVRENAEYPT
jgi:glutamate N-acetyltransferase/amino-acid N-acetyltransferase